MRRRFPFLILFSIYLFYFLASFGVVVAAAAALKREKIDVFISFVHCIGAMRSPIYMYLQGMFYLDGCSVFYHLYL